MKKILLMGLGPSATEAEIRSFLLGYGQVISVEVVREGDSTAPVALVGMDITDEQAFNIVSLINGYWHDGYLISARLLTH